MDEIRISSFETVPEFARGLVRDIRVRWVLAELGKPYSAQLIAFADRTSPSYRSQSPFGLIPVMQIADGVLFESGAIVFALAEKSDLVLAGDAGRFETLAWMFAALNTVEPYITLLLANDTARADVDWARQARPDILAAVERNLEVLEGRLAERDFLLEAFTIADIMMVTTLRFLRHTNIVAQFAAVQAYVARCTERPAFIEAERAQLADYDRAGTAAAA